MIFESDSELSASQKALLHSIRAGVVLLLLTPLLVDTRSVFPFAVPKALYSRALIEIVAVLWVLLALARPSYRPPRSWLLLLLGCGLGASALAAFFGVSLERSLWSTYQRMQGVLDLAHWFALAVVAVSVFRTGRDWAVLLNLNLGAGLVIALIAVAKYYALDVPFFGDLPERNYPRIGATLGNATYLGAYSLMNSLVALGFLLRSFFRASPHSERDRKRGGKRSRKRGSGRLRRAKTDRSGATPWTGRFFWGICMLFSLWACGLTGSLGVALGLASGGGFLVALYAVLGRTGGVRLAAKAVIILLAAGAVVFATMFLTPADSFDRAFESPLQRIVKPDIARRSAGQRLVSWEAGLKGFVKRPLLGWGPENYIVPFGRYVPAEGAEIDVHDYAHNALVEEAATRGVVGLAAYLALWAVTFLVVARSAGRAGPGKQALALSVGAALAGYFVQSQTLFVTTATSLQHVLLLGFLVRLEASLGGGERLFRLARPAAALRPLFCGKAVRITVALSAIALGTAGLVTNHAIYSAATTLRRAEVTPGRFMDYTRESIEAFRPLANFQRVVLFENLAFNWKALHSAGRGAEADGLLRWAEREAAEAVRTEPENWKIHQSLVRMYGAAKRTRPEYAAAERRHLERSSELAPNRPVLAPGPGRREARGVKRAP